MIDQPPASAMKRHGIRCEVGNRKHVATKTRANIAEDMGSLEKFVSGVMVASKVS